MKPWTRIQTKTWISDLETRITDIHYYLNKTSQYCEDHYIYDDREVFVFSFLTVLWVSHMRGEPISQIELLEFLGIPEGVTDEEKIYDIGPELADADYEEFLKIVSANLNKGNYLPS